MIKSDMTDGPDHHRQRSEFIRGLVQRPAAEIMARDRYVQGPPKTIVQFWHDLQELPTDIEECIASWRRWTDSGFKHLLFDERSARAFIRGSLGRRHEYSFDRCYHPAMQADYFRLCYLLVEGGFYVDADDVCIGSQIHWLFDDGRLKIHPLCYDIAAASMVNTGNFLADGAHRPHWIFYVNNNPLVTSKRHPIIKLALQRATERLESTADGELPEIQETTGPGNLSRSIFELGAASEALERDLVVLRDWDSFAISRWPLSYRDDARNWRLSNQKRLERDQK
ncbi:glycosyltransferase family 32 protein [Bradyrhizobium sp. USDA 3650]